MFSDELTVQLNQINVDTSVYRLIYDPKKRPNLLINHGGAEWELYDNKDVWHSARKWAKEMYQDCANALIFGAGFGYHIKAYTALLKPSQILYVFEPDLSILKIALAETDIEEILRHESVRFFAGDTDALLRPIYNSLYVWPVGVSLYAQGLRAKPLAIERITQTLEIFMTRDSFTPPDLSPADVSANFGFAPKPVKPYRIIFVSANDIVDSVTRSFFDNLLLSFAILGCDARYVMWEEFVGKMDNLPALCDFVICCNARVMFESAVPIISIGIDRPYHLRAALKLGGNFSNIIYTWTEPADVLTARKYYFKKGKNAFLPHGAEINLNLRSVFKTERYIDVVISSNYDDVSIESLWQKGLPRDTVNKIIARYEAGGLTWEDCVKDVVNPCSDERLFEFMANAGYELDNYMRFKKKEIIIKGLLDRGIVIHCFGNHWFTTEFMNHPNFLYHGFYECEPMRELFTRTKIIINITSIFLTGSHERVFSSMIRGALCVTDFTGYLGEHFTDGSDIVFYDHRNLDALASKIKYYLAHEDERLRITKAAFEKVRLSHTWLNRAEMLLDIYEAHGNQGSV